MRTNRPEDLWNRVQVGEPDECWPWLGATTGHGYGAISVDGLDVSAHRLAFELTNGVDPQGGFVCHHCDNPPCCNPAHLYLGTPKDNTDDMHRRGRWPSRRGERHPLSKLSDEQRSEIVRRRRNGERNCDLAFEYRVAPSTITRLEKEAREEIAA